MAWYRDADKEAKLIAAGYAYREYALEGLWPTGTRNAEAMAYLIGELVRAALELPGREAAPDAPQSPVTKQGGIGHGRDANA